METRAKRRKMSVMPSTSFEDLPDEIILKILSFVEYFWKVRCFRVSKRLRRICSDESLWHTSSINGQFEGAPSYSMPLTHMPVPVSFVNHFLKNGCKNLQMMNIGLFKDVAWASYNQLEFLDLNNVRIYQYPLSKNEEDWDPLIKSCKSLKMFSLDIARPWLNSFTNFNQAPIIQKICLQNKETLKVLKLKLPSISFRSIRTIVDHSVELKELSISIYDNIRQPLSCEQLTYLAENLTPNIEKLSLRKTGRNLNEKHLETLFTRFELTELNLNYSGATLASFTAVAKKHDRFENTDFGQMKKGNYFEQL